MLIRVWREASLPVIVETVRAMNRVTEIMNEVSSALVLQSVGIGEVAASQAPRNRAPCAPDWYADDVRLKRLN